MAFCCCNTQNVSVQTDGTPDTVSYRQRCAGFLNMLLYLIDVPVFLLFSVVLISEGLDPVRTWSSDAGISSEVRVVAVDGPAG